jgi:hypothetical protein
LCWACLAHQNVTHQKIERGRGLGVAKEGDIADGINEYAIGNNGNKEPLAEGDDDDDKEYAKDGNIADNNDDGGDKPLEKGDYKYDTLSAACAQACSESQCTSVPSR